MESSPDMDSYEVINGRGAGDGAVSCEDGWQHEDIDDSSERLIEDIGPAGHDDDDYEDDEEEEMDEGGQYGDDDIEEELDKLANSNTSYDEGLGTSEESARLQTGMAGHRDDVCQSYPHEDATESGQEQDEDSDVQILQEKEEETEQEHPDLRKRVKDKNGVEGD